MVRGTIGGPAMQSMRALRLLITTSDSTWRCGWQVQITVSRLFMSGLASL